MEPLSKNKFYSFIQIPLTQLFNKTLIIIVALFLLQRLLGTKYSISLISFIFLRIEVNFQATVTSLTGKRRKICIFATLKFYVPKWNKKRDAGLCEQFYLSMIHFDKYEISCYLNRQEMELPSR